MLSRPGDSEISISPWKYRFKINSSLDIGQYINFAHDYTIRKLSFAEDGLPAITGLLSLMSSPFSGSFISGLPQRFFDEALLWQPNEAMQRRQAATFADNPPSWSWVGWEGEIMQKEWRSHFTHLGSEASTICQVAPLVTRYHGKKLEECNPVISSSLPSGANTNFGWHKEHIFKRKQVPSSHAQNTPVLARYLFCRTKSCVFWKIKVYDPGQSRKYLPRVALKDSRGNRVGSLIVDLSDQGINVDKFELVAISQGSVIDHDFRYFDNREKPFHGCALK